MDINELHFFKPKKGSRDLYDSVYFSITKNEKSNYVSVKFQIGINISKKLQITNNSKISFACNKNNHTIWYLVVTEHVDGYSVRKTNNNEYVTFISFPFHYLSLNMQQLNKNNLELDLEKRIIKIDVSDIIDKEKLLLK